MTNDRLAWLFVFFALYATYCVFWGVDCARERRGAMDFFLAERGVPSWVYVAAATILTFTGWVAIGLPATVLRDGFPGAALALGAIVTPLAGAAALSRQWMLSRRFGYVTPVQMYADYFGGPVIRPVLLLIALLFALPYLGMQMAATGYLFQVLSDGFIPWVFAMWALGALVFLYVCLGGIRAAAFVAVLQALLFAAALVAIGVIAWVELGGFASFVGLLDKLGAAKVGDWGASSTGYSAMLTTPGVVQFVAGYGKEAPVGGVWTTTMVLSTALSLIGLQLAPAFGVLAFSARDARGFAPQQVWAAAATIGFGMVFFAVIAGMGALFLGASPAVDQAGLAIAISDLPPLGQRARGRIDRLLPQLAGGPRAVVSRLARRRRSGGDPGDRGALFIGHRHDVRARFLPAFSRAHGERSPTEIFRPRRPRPDDAVRVAGRDLRAACAGRDRRAGARRRLPASARVGRDLLAALDHAPCGDFGIDRRSRCRPVHGQTGHYAR